MTKSAMIRVRVEPKAKAAAEEIFRALGISASAAVNLFYQQVAVQKNLPFDLRRPEKPALETPARKPAFDEVLGDGWVY